MNNFTIPTLRLLLLAILNLPVFAIAQSEFTTDNPVDYSNFIVNEQEKVGHQFIEFSMLLVNSNDSKTNEQKRIAVIQEIELGLRRLRNMAPFKGGSQLRNESIAVFKLYKKLHLEEYAKLSVLVSNKESSMETLEAYFKLKIKAEKQMRKNAIRLQDAQEKFAKNNKLALVHNPMQQQFDQILGTNIYSREVFLGYISIAKLNEAWWDALQKDEFEEMEKQRIALLNAVNNSPLKTMEGLNGQTGFRDVALQRVNWYSSLAAKEYKTVREILMNASRSAEDVAYFNEMVNAYNEKNSEQNDQFNLAARDLKARALKPTNEKN